MRRILVLFALLLAFEAAAVTGPERIIPRPARFEVTKGAYKYDGNVKVVVPSKALAKEVKDLPDFARNEAYRLSVGKKGIKIEALTDEGVFRARTSLEMMLEYGDTLSCCVITDWPRFAYRGIMLDESRHFRGKDYIKKELDQMARLKMSIFHLHMTDGAGWRFQTGKYPELATRGGFRIGKTYLQWEANGYPLGREGDGVSYGGYFTKDDLREIVAYAAERYIDVIPEIEMPGHSYEVTKVYPETACIAPDGSRVYNHSVCPGSDETFRIFQAVIDEVVEIFPYKYIHIGGDECDKKGWRNCPKCKARMEKEGISDLNALQSWFTTQMEKYINSKGRSIIGWDEILEGGLAPNATVMSWRGTAGGKKAVAMDHDVIMVPTSRCYLDYYQDAPVFEPQAIGAYLPCERVYSYDPGRDFSPSDIHHVLGLQGNLWCEFIPTVSKAEYMLYPRAFAIAEIGWTPQERREWKEFKTRALDYIEVIKAHGYNAFDLAAEKGNREAMRKRLDHFAVGKPITFNKPYDKGYHGSWDVTLNDGLFGSWEYPDDRWLGFRDGIDVTVDLGEVKDIHYIGGSFIRMARNDIGIPGCTEVWLSDDGGQWRLAASKKPEIPDYVRDFMIVDIAMPMLERARFVRYKAVKKETRGNYWMFLDELVVL